ncbi:urease accessory protein UreD [Helicobacter sp. 11S03491-1]|uniref:urease accessory protein UreD n=1 Tax=Helicobacter sp. 11S03491-1 TaxID=1476196 RepID=UPI000BA6DDB7|nr:urease accessory protein UreD [Helicobacter sp. 11S03491-1]PAF43928.1 urease accessory protein [Helicobacter sp. 11S03491-1]
MTNYAQESKLSFKTKLDPRGKCILEDVFFTPPLKLMPPFYEEEDRANLMLISVSAGLMEGDNQEIDLEIGKDCNLKLSSQSFEKIHDTKDGFASRNTRIHVHSNATFDFAPLPIIPFKNSCFKGDTTITLEPSSRLFYSEIICAGRVGRDEIFEFRSFSTGLKIFLQEKLVFFDNTILDPQKTELRNKCLFDKYTHYLNLVIFDPSVCIQNIREILQRTHLNAGVSELAYNGGICLKALSDTSEDLLLLRDSVCNLRK